MKKKYLFVGGKADGQMIDADEKMPFWQVPYYSECEPNNNPDLMTTTFKQETYRKITWKSGDNQEFTFFALESLTNHVVMQMILNNYKPFRQSEENKKFKRHEIMLERCVRILEDFLKSSFPFPSGELIKNIYNLIGDVNKFLLKENDKK